MVRKDPQLHSKSTKTQATGWPWVSVTRMLHSQTIINSITRIWDMADIWSAVTKVFSHLISGSWSSFDSTKNNVVTAFSYSKGDTILITYNPDENKIVFKRKGT
jgi:hypothetical protein